MLYRKSDAKKKANGEGMLLKLGTSIIIIIVIIIIIIIIIIRRREGWG